jgi:alkanesulfonate monooxygenase SsuD/methylene tetrahydromethanopterin reductase-like flavin-dependent oxidoreductase (luciferase family)
VRHGIGLPNQIRDVNPAIIPSWASRAEAAGFTSLATIGRIAYPGVMDTVALAAAAAATTTTIGLTSTVMLTTTQPAILLAKELAGIAGISGNRLTLGVGIGGDRPDDYVVESLPPSGLGRRMDRDLALYQSIWRGDPVGGGNNPAVPPSTQPIPLMFGGSAQAVYRRMARWGEGYIGGSLPVSMVEPMFESSRRAWREADRKGEPKLVAIAYFAFADEDLARKTVYDYYRAAGDAIATMIAGSVHIGSSAIKTAAASFKEIGADELILNPAIADPNEIGKLADAVL